MALILSTSRVTPATCVYTALHGCYGFRASSTSPVTTVISASKAPPSPSVSLSFNCDSQHHSLKLVNFRLLWVVKEEMYREVSVNGLNIQRREKFKAFFLSKRSLSLLPSDFRRMHNHHIHDPHHHCHQPAWEAGCTLGSAILVFLGLNIAFWTSPVLMVGFVCIGTKRKKFQK